MQQVRMDFALTNDSTANVVIGLVYFFIIACAFFIQYKVVFRKNLKIVDFFKKIFKKKKTEEGM